MNLDFLLLAEHAAAHEGQLFIHGGGIRSVRVPRLPYPWHGAIAGRLTANRTEIGSQHTLSVAGYAPDGTAVFTPAAPAVIDLTPDVIDDELDDEVGVLLALELAVFLLRAAGTHRLTLILDDEVIGELVFRVDVDDTGFQPA